MLSKRKNALELIDDDLSDAEVEEIVLSDQDINEIFQVYKKGKPPVNKKSTKASRAKKAKSIADKLKVPSRLNRSEINQTEDKNDNDVELLSDDEIDMLPEAVASRPIYNNSNKDDDSDDIICVSSPDSSIVNNKQVNLSEDICLIDSIPSTSDRTSTRRSIRSSARKNLRKELITPNKADNSTSFYMNSSFDTAEIDPNIVAQFKFVKTLRLKFKFKGSYKCVEFKSTDKFKDKLDEMCEVLEVTPNSLLLMFNNKPISFENTPEELNIGICDIIDVYEKKQNATSQKEDPNLFKFKFRDHESRKRVEDIVLTMNRYDTFQQIFKNYSELKQVSLDKITFEFDGEVIESDQKPDDLEMESDYLIDVKIKN